MAVKYETNTRHDGACALMHPINVRLFSLVLTKRSSSHVYEAARIGLIRNTKVRAAAKEL